MTRLLIRFARWRVARWLLRTVHRGPVLFVGAPPSVEEVSLHNQLASLTVSAGGLVVVLPGHVEVVEHAMAFDDDAAP